MNGNSRGGEEGAKVPRDLRLVTLILSSLGVQAYAERVPLQLLDFAYRYTQQILQDAQIYSEHAENKQITSDDVRLAISARVSHCFRGPAPKDFMLELATERNRKPLPPVTESFGVRNPREHALLAPDWSTLAELPDPVQTDGIDEPMADAR